MLVLQVRFEPCTYLLSHCNPEDLCVLLFSSRELARIKMLVLQVGFEPCTC